MLELAAHQGRAADRPAQRHLVDHGPQPQAARGEPPLPLLAQVHQPVRLLRGVRAKLDDGGRVVLGLQQAGHELGVEAADGLGRLLQPDVGLEPGRQHVLIAVPPALLVGLAGQGQQLLALGHVGDPVQVQQIRDVDLAHGIAAKLDPADL